MRRLSAVVAAGILLMPAAAWAAPNDPYYSFQWGLRKIRSESSWSVTKGRGSVIAVIDTGVDADHPDLVGRVLPGRNFAGGSADDTADPNGHGTLIAGIIAATTGNGVGVASVAPSSKVLPVRVLEADGNGSSEAVADGIDWAVSQGADVINLSLAEEGGDTLFDTLLSDPGIDGAIRRAADAGRTVVVAAGNDDQGGRSETAYDAVVRGVVVVGASTTEDRRGAYSNYGQGLDLLAPGGGSATEAGEGGCTEKNSIVSTWWNRSTKKAAYGGGCGTSMAVAFVSGVAAQLHARGYSNARAVDRILATADDIGADGRDAQTGNGRLNAARALGAPTTAPPPATAPARPKTSPPKQTLKAQGGSTPVDRSSAKATPSSAPSPKLIPSKPGLERPSLAAGGNGGDEQGRGWPVSAASFLAAAMVLVHYWRWAVLAQRR